MADAKAAPANLAAIGEMVASITKQYPAFAPLMKIPDIANLLIEASQPGQQWSTTKFQTAIQGTNWYKTTSAPARQWQTLQLVQPGEAARQSAQTAIQIHQLASQEGIILTPEEISNLTNLAQSQSYNAAQIQQAVGEQASQRGLTAGTIQSTADALGKTAQDYGVPLAPATAFQWSQKIAEGTATTDGFTAYAQNQAKQLFPTLAQHIDQGMTVRQLADPYLQIAGQTLGIDPNSLSINDPKWTAALQSRDAKGQVVGPMSQADWTSKIMQDPTYGYDHSEPAKLAANQVAEQLGTAMGFFKT